MPLSPKHSSGDVVGIYLVVIHEAIHIGLAKLGPTKEWLWRQLKGIHPQLAAPPKFRSVGPVIKTWFMIVGMTVNKLANFYNETLYTFNFKSRGQAR